MNPQTSLPGIAASTLTENRAVAESDLRGEVALAIMAYLTWAQFHGGETVLLDGTVDRWLCAGKPDDPQISKSLVKLRLMLARYVNRGGHVPEWVPKSLLAALGEPWCARDLAPSSAPQSDALPACSPTVNAQPSTAHSGHSATNSSPKNPETEDTQKE